MTLVVGVLCTDGAVIASDSAVTFGGDPGTISDKQRKISIIDDALIVAGTGQLGLGQRFEFELDMFWRMAKPGNALANQVEISTEITRRTLLNFQNTGAPPGQYGALLAFPASNAARLCEFAVTDFQPQLKSERLWYASMGSGQSLADPYLRLMRHVFWRNGPPTLQSGKFATMWVMHHAIIAAPGRIAPPIDMAVLEMTSAGPVARMLTSEELEEHNQAVLASTEHLREFEEQVLIGGLQGEPRSIPKIR